MYAGSSSFFQGCHGGNPVNPNGNFNPVSGVQGIIDGAWQAWFIVLNRCGHWVQVDYRGLFNRSVLDFLQHG